MYPLSLYEPLDTVAEPVIGYVLLVFVVVNIVARALAYRSHRNQAHEGDADAVSRYLPLEATNVVLVLGSFYLITLEYHAGMVLSTLVIGMLLTDFFEFESRKVEARRDIPLERPNSAIAASVLVFLYAGYQALFFVIAPVWNSIV